MEILELNEIKKRIALARKESGFTQEEMAKLLNISQPAYSYYETGDKPLPLRRIKYIAKILERPLNFFLGEAAEEMEKEPVLEAISGHLVEISNQLKRIGDLMERKA